MQGTRWRAWPATRTFGLCTYSTRILISTNTNGRSGRRARGQQKATQAIQIPRNLKESPNTHASDSRYDKLVWSCNVYDEGCVCQSLTSTRSCLTLNDFFSFLNRIVCRQAKVSPPALKGKKTGVFSTRSPHHPNAIGIIAGSFATLLLVLFLAFVFMFQLCAWCLQ